MNLWMIFTDSPGRVDFGARRAENAVEVEGLEAPFQVDSDFFDQEFVVEVVVRPTGFRSLDLWNADVMTPAMEVVAVRAKLVGEPSS